MATFKLDQEPWIPVIDSKGVGQKVSLLQAFEQASSIHEIVGTPLEIASIVRLLLGIAQLTETPATLARWRDIWDERSSFMIRCAEYIRRNNVWDLFHPDVPFLQDKRLAGTQGSAAVKSASVEPIEPTFINRGKLGVDPFVFHAAGESLYLEPDAAARALIVAHSFAVGGTGTPNPLIPRRNGQEDKYSKNSLLAQKLVVFIHESPLDKLLLLNLQCSVIPGMPGWQFPGVTQSDPVPCSGVADRYTRPAAAILLYPEANGQVGKATLTIGATFCDIDSLDDPMLPHTRAGDEYKPLKLDRSRALWRSAHVVLSTSDRPVPLIAQLKKLCTRQYVNVNSGRLRAVGICGEPGRVKHYMWRDETLPFGFSVISDDTRFAQLLRAVTAAEEAGSALRKRIYSFAARYLQNGAESKPDKNDVARLADELSPNLTDFWSALAPAGERIACDGFDENAWAGLIRSASDFAFRHAIDRLPPDSRRYRAEYARAMKSETEGAT